MRYFSIAHVDKVSGITSVNYTYYDHKQISANLEIFSSNYIQLANAMMTYLKVKIFL